MKASAIPGKKKRMQAGVCAYCERRVFPNNHVEARNNPACRATRDHVEPQLLGSTKPRDENLVVACYECNSVKGHYPLEPFLFFLRAHKGTPKFNVVEFRRFIYGLTMAGFVAAKAVAENDRRAA
jgi:hypothetical protein